MPEFKFILLARDCDSTAIVYNYLAKHIPVEKVILENPVERKKQFCKRKNRLGWMAAISQAAFMVGIVPFIRMFSQKRKKEIFKHYHLDNTPLPVDKIIRVHSLNSDHSRNLLKEINPDLILINGTRILSKKTLDAVAAPFINIHTGITPAFRGVHGGYWAVASGQKDLFGTTIHYVDTGIDTGGIIEQIFSLPNSKDNFCTYPYLQYATALPSLLSVISRFAAGEKPAIKPPVVSNSALWFHPTLWQWIKNINRTFLLIFSSAFIS
jgi:hypothetical protein